MQSKLIVMLTHNDQTVEGAIKIFEDCRDLPVDCWGFKNVGIPESEMCKLLAAIKAAGKKAFLEVVTYTEESCIDSAKFACKHNFDFLLGTLFFPRVWEYLKTQAIQYFPFIGNVSGNPSILAGSLECMINQANEFYAKNIPGIDILTYRYVDGNPEQLTRKLVEQMRIKTIIAGSIDSVDRIKTVNDINPWAFTIGSALITQKFARGFGYRANLEKVLEVMNALDTPLVIAS